MQLTKRSPTQGRRHLHMESFTGTFHRDCVLASFHECRRHYSSWEVSRESQSSPLRFFVESIATDHQEVSYFFSENKTVLLRIRTRDLEPRIVSPDHLATVTYLFYYYYLRYLKLPSMFNSENRPPQALESLDRL